jgi:hypothetical protein
MCGSPSTRTRRLRQLMHTRGRHCRHRARPAGPAASWLPHITTAYGITADDPDGAPTAGESFESGDCAGVIAVSFGSGHHPSDS